MKERMSTHRSSIAGVSYGKLSRRVFERCGGTSSPTGACVHSAESATPSIKVR